MTNEPKPKYLEDMARYSSANAGIYALAKAEEEEQGAYLKGASKTLIDKLYDPATPDLDILEKAATASAEGMKIMLNEANKKYESVLRECTFSDLYTSNSKSIDKLIPADKKEKFNSTLAKYGAKSVGSILDSYNDAKLTKKQSDKTSNKEQKEEADKTIQELEPIASIISQIKRATAEFSDDYNKIREYAYQEMFSQAVDAVKV